MPITPRKGSGVKEDPDKKASRVSRRAGQACPGPLPCGCTAGLQEEAKRGTSHTLRAQNPFSVDYI